MNGTNQPWDEVALRLVGKPFRWGARGPDYFDCWGLVLAALTIAKRPLPPDYTAAEGEEETAMAAACASPRWLHVEHPIDGDVVAMSARVAIHHVGLWLPHGVLHAAAKRGAVLTRPQLLRAAGYSRLEYYRWAG